MAKTILIVDDTKTITSLIQVFLMGWDFTFAVAQDGIEGLLKARELRPALVISDVQMERLDGYGLCSAIRADSALRETPVVMLTSLKDEAARARGREVGATAFLNKPVTVGELRETVSRLLNLPLHGSK